MFAFQNPHSEATPITYFGFYLIYAIRGHFFLYVMLSFGCFCISIAYLQLRLILQLVGICKKVVYTNIRHIVFHTV